MTESLLSMFDEMREAEEQQIAEGRIKPRSGTWRRICVCGHLEKYHSEAIGGEIPADRTVEVNHPIKPYTKHFVSIGCAGPPQSKGADRRTTTANEDRTVHTETLHPTCPCLKFQPVAEALSPRFRFNQKLPLVIGSRVRDYSWNRHPLAMGFRATVTSCSNLKVVKAKQSEDWPERKIDELVMQLVNERFRWLDGAQECWTPGCKRTGNEVRPVFVENDQSEMRCSDHRLDR